MYKDVTIMLGNRKIFAERHSISAREFYDAGIQDLKPEYKFKVYDFEYHGEKFLVYDGVRYVIYRTFQPDDKVELYAATKAGEMFGRE
jgi:phage head-tail adaptor, putative, SPP1 family